MSIYLSRTKIDSFCGNVVCLRLCADEELTNADIKWSASNNNVRIRDFKDAGEFALNDGILVALEKCGNAVVSAELDGKKYECNITVNERRMAADDDKFNYYIGDFHVHTSWDHSIDGFPRREKDFPADAIAATKKDGRLDFTVISDHGSRMSPRDLFRAFWDADRAESEDLIVFPGSESEAEFIETDHFGNFQRRNSEFVCVNSTDYVFAKSMEEIEEVFAKSILPIFSVAHPVTYSTQVGGGMCGFDFYTQQLPVWKNSIHMIEIGNGSDRGTTMLFEHNYSIALDCGFKVSPCSPSDTHGPEYGFEAMPGKTVFMAPEKSKEMFIDAILKNRVYATESGNTKLYFTVNGYGMGRTLPETDTYVFHIELGDLDPSNPTKFVKCEVVSDYENRVMTISDFESNTLDFTVKNTTGRYFYLRITDSEGKKTYSAPVWTGRAFDDYAHRTSLKRLDKRNFRARDAAGGVHAYKLTSGNPKEAWYPGTKTASAIIDMREAQTFCGVEIYAPYTTIYQGRTLPEFGGLELISEFASKYRISVSEDGENFREVAKGYIRVFNLGYVVEFEECTAQYIKIDFLETVGKTSGLPHHVDHNISIGEIEVLTK